MSESESPTAVLVMAMGGPSGPDEIESFVTRFLGGRRPSPERMEAIRRRYARIGGRSPLVEITLRQAEALRAELTRMGCRLPVFVGMRFSEPFLSDVLDEIRDRDIRWILALPLVPFRSKLSTEPYFAALDEAIAARKTGFAVLRVTGWHTHPLFIDALEEKITEGFSWFSPDLRPTVGVVFSVHSLPERPVCGDPYVREIHETIERLLERIGLRTWRLGFQSRGGGTEPWLEPDVGEVLKDFSRVGGQRVLVVPLGFVSDHLETLYDLDIQCREQAAAFGIEYHRSPSLNDSPRFVRALAQIVLERLDKMENQQVA
jgi:ferrochelatase